MTVVGLAPSQVRDVATSIGRGSDRLRQIRQELSALLEQSTWRGHDAQDFRSQWGQHSTAITTTAERLDEAREVLLKQVSQQESTSNEGGAIGLAGSTALLATQSSMVAATQDSSRSEHSDRRDPDGRRGRRIRRDEDFRREPGGDGSNSWLSNDWAGRAILGRYLTGGDDWVLENDPAWTEYMQESPELTAQMVDQNNAQAIAAVENYQRSNATEGNFDTTTHAEMQNGEGIVGHQYLHGTNADAGDFKHHGNTSVRPLPDGTYEVTINSNYQWNDVIDPNPQYSTDNAKNLFAEVITLGQADPYNIHIGWTGQSTVIVDANGNVVEGSGKGWPYE